MGKEGKALEDTAIHIERAFQPFFNTFFVQLLHPSPLRDFVPKSKKKQKKVQDKKMVSEAESTSWTFFISSWRVVKLLY